MAVIAIKIVTDIILNIMNMKFSEVKTKLFRAAQVIPMVKAEINKELDKMVSDCHKKFSDKRKGNVILDIPKKGMP